MDPEKTNETSPDSFADGKTPPGPPAKPDRLDFLELTHLGDLVRVATSAVEILKRDMAQAQRVQMERAGEFDTARKAFWQKYDMVEGVHTLTPEGDIVRITKG